MERPHVPAIRLGHRSSFLLAVTSLFGVVAFGWPLLIHQHAGENTAHSGDAPWIFVALVPLLIAIVVAELSEGGIDAKAIALLGILAACFATLRIASPGIDGFEPEWFLLILSGRVFGRGFGFVLGSVAFFVSALVTGGVGPWLPFQMLAAAWVGFGAGSLPPTRGFAERGLLAAYGAAAALAYGLLTQFLVLALRQFGHELLVCSRWRRGGKPAPLLAVRSHHLNGIRSHSRGHLRHLDLCARPPRSGSTPTDVAPCRL